MKQQYAQEWPYFFTATIQEWKHLLADDKYKNIVIECLQFLVNENKVTIIGFTIMSNHLHFIWQAKGNNAIKDIQNSFMRCILRIKFTSRRFMQLNRADGTLESYQVNKIDRSHNFWQRDSLSVELFTPTVLIQKLNYIHYNATKAGLCKFPEDYYYSSALFYPQDAVHENVIDHFNIISHYLG